MLSSALLIRPRRSAKSSMRTVPTMLMPLFSANRRANLSSTIKSDSSGDCRAKRIESISPAPRLGDNGSAAKPGVNVPGAEVTSQPSSIAASMRWLSVPGLAVHSCLTASVMLISENNFCKTASASILAKAISGPASAITMLAACRI